MRMRIGGPILAPDDPDTWAAAVREAGYRAAFCPVGPDADGDKKSRFRDAAHEADIVIAEVGAWSNPISTDPIEREKARHKCCEMLSLADSMGARCCVNIAGSRGNKWDGPGVENLSRKTFDAIVESVRGIIDEVEPTDTYYTLETMPWVFPDSPDTYLELIEAVDRDRFAAHLDPVNLINSPRRYFGNSDLLRECFDKLGPHIRSCHAKDTLIRDDLTLHIDEVRPGLGNLDYRTYLSELEKIDPDTPLMLEHLSSPEEYSRAFEYVKGIAEDLGLGH
jgi:sugar phosphate isomerase/epimerase